MESSVPPDPANAVALTEAQPRPPAREDTPTRPDALDNVFGLTVLQRLFSGDDPGNPGAVDLLHGEQVAVDADLVASLWGAS